MSRFGVLGLLVAICMVSGIGAIDCDSPPKRTDLKACCPHDDLISEEIADQCRSFLGQDDEPATRKQLLNACYLECAVKATEIMNGHDVDQAKLKTYLTTVLKRNPEIIPVVETAFETCAQKLDELRELIETNPIEFYPPTPGDCKPCLGVLLHCVKMETIYNCPASIWKASEECNNHREYFRKCLPSLGQHPH